MGISGYKMGTPLSWINLPVITVLLLALQQRLEARVVAQGVPDWINAKQRKRYVAGNQQQKFDWFR